VSTDGTSANSVPLGPDGKIVFNDAPRKRGGCLKAVLIALAVVVALIAVLVFVVFKTTAGAEKQARGFVTEVIANDVDAAYNRTATDFREATSKASLGELAGRLNSILSGAKVTNTGRSIASSTGSKAIAAIDYTATKADRKVYLRVNVRKDSQGWKVVNFQSSEKPIPDEDAADTAADSSIAA
jgi:uncharacterized protein (UPF0333 family)